MPSTRFAAAVVLIALVTVVVILWVYPSPTDFATSNRRWNGLYDAVHELGLVPLASLEDLPRAAAQTALIVIPTLPPRIHDLEALQRYVEAGGTLIIMNDFGFGNAILTRLGIAARFGDQLLVDPLFSYRSRRLPRVVDLLGGPLAEGVKTLVLNRATTISDTPGIRVVARSALSSFLDANRNGHRDPDEPQGPFIVVALARVRAGRVVLISDASIATNGMLKLENNRRFLANVLEMQGTREKTFIDQSLLPRGPMDVAKLALDRTRTVFGYPAIAFAVIAGAMATPLVLWRPAGGGR